MQTPNYDLQINQGTDFSINLEIETLDSNNFILSGYTPYSQIRKSYSDANISCNIVTTISNTNGILNLYIDSANTANLNLDMYVYDVILKSANSYPIKLLQGKIYTSFWVTRNV